MKKNGYGAPFVATAGERGPRPRILGLAGSLRPQSVSHDVLSSLARLLGQQGADVHILDPRRLHLPFCSGSHSDEYVGWPDVAVLRQAFLDSQGLLLVTPEYHGSISGILKNVLDLLDFPHLEGKVAGLVSVLGGRANSNALNHLRTSLRWCRAWTIPEQVAIAGSRAGLQAALAVDPELQERLEALAASLVRATLLLSGGEISIAGVEERRSGQTLAEPA
jgi:FMN reductase